jgi:hypothetical protein
MGDKQTHLLQNILFMSVSPFTIDVGNVLRMRSCCITAAHAQALEK